MHSLSTSLPPCPCPSVYSKKAPVFKKTIFFSICYFGHVDTSLLETTLFSIKITSSSHTYLLIIMTLLLWNLFLLIWHRNRMFMIANVLTSCTLRVFCGILFFCPLGNFSMVEIFHWLLTYHY